jgi:hypothetical protein
VLFIAAFSGLALVAEYMPAPRETSFNLELILSCAAMGALVPFFASKAMVARAKGDLILSGAHISFSLISVGISAYAGLTLWQ